MIIFKNKVKTGIKTLKTMNKGLEIVKTFTRQSHSITDPRPHLSVSGDGGESGRYPREAISIPQTPKITVFTDPSR